MKTIPIPWQKNDIYHDDLSAYPLEDYLPLTASDKAEETDESDENWV